MNRLRLSQLVSQGVKRFSFQISRYTKAQTILRPHFPFVTPTCTITSSAGVGTPSRMAATGASDGFIRLTEEEKKRFDTEIRLKAIKIPKQHCNKYMRVMNKCVNDLMLFLSTSHQFSIGNCLSLNADTFSIDNIYDV